jgi:hypothetical protein
VPEVRSMISFTFFCTHGSSGVKKLTIYKNALVAVLDQSLLGHPIQVIAYAHAKHLIWSWVIFSLVTSATNGTAVNVSEGSSLTVTIAGTTPAQPV